MGLSRSVEQYADDISSTGAVWFAGSSSRQPPRSGIPVVHAPAGIVEYHPEEMTVSCGAGTTLADLDATLAERGQYANLGQAHQTAGTVGGALAMGLDDHLRLGRGSMRDALLRARFVDGRGRLVTAGGPTVKNVSGFDLCRLLVGSRGRLGGLADVILRTRPLPRHREWWHLSGLASPAGLVARLYRPSAVLWDGTSAWVHLEGHAADIAALRRDLGSAVTVVDSPPDLSRYPYRSPSTGVESADAIVEVGTGVTHTRERVAPSAAPAAVRAIHDRLLDEFDPERRFAHGPHPLDW